MLPSFEVSWIFLDSVTESLTFLGCKTFSKVRMNFMVDQFSDSFIIYLGGFSHRESMQMRFLILLNQESLTSNVKGM